MTKPLIELVEEYGQERWEQGDNHARQGCHSAENESRKEADRLLAEIRQRLEAMERDAARFQFLQNLGHVEAQAFFWRFESRKQRSEAIDAAMTASCLPNQGKVTLAKRLIRKHYQGGEKR